MSEPKTVADKITRIAPGLLHWTLHDDRIGFRSDAYALEADGGALLIDPLPLPEKELNSLGRVQAICLTIQSHQRSAWRYRKRFGVKVYAPAGAEGLEEEPDEWYRDGARLPGGLRAVHSPGPCGASYAFHLERPGETSMLFLGDLLIRAESDDELRFVDDEYQDDPGQTRKSVRSISALPAETALSGHGAPVLSGGNAAVIRALEEDAAATKR